MPVETINESALQSVNKVFEITSGSIANVKVGGKRSVIDRLDSTDIRATADLSNLSSVNAVNIVPSLRKKVSSDVTLECTQVLKVALEDMATKQVKVTVVTQGEPDVYKRQIESRMKELECARKEIMQVFKAMSDIATHNVSDTEKTNTALGAMTADFKNIEQSTESLRTMADALANHIQNFQV